MKKLLLMSVSALCLLLASCGPKFTFTTVYLDYSHFLEDGFFITESLDPPFDYTPIGSMTVGAYSGNVKSEDASKFKKEEEPEVKGKKNLR